MNFVICTAAVTVVFPAFVQLRACVSEVHTLLGHAAKNANDPDNYILRIQDASINVW